MNKTITVAAAIGVVLALGFSLGAIPAGLNAQAQSEPTPFPSREKTISVTGQASTAVKPDRLNINFGVEVQKPTAKEALDENTAKMNEVIAAIKSAGLPMAISAHPSSQFIQCMSHTKTKKQVHTSKN